MAKVPKFGFETAIALPKSYASYKVEALGADGRVIGTSAPFASHS